MVNLLKTKHADAQGAPGSPAAAPPGTAFWPVDKLILGYGVFTSIVLVIWWGRISDAPMLASLHVALAALMVLEVKFPNRTSHAFRHWYPLLYVACCYKEMALLIPAVRSSDADRWLANLDFRIWGANPTVWLERVHTPALTEFLQIAYTLFIPAVMLVPVLLWLRRQYRDFQYYAFLIALGFLASYVGYLLVPARGPRFLLASLQHEPLRGLWLFARMQGGLDRLESAHYDCFPSGHTALTMLAAWGSRMVSKRLHRVYLFYTPLIIFATVYLRYHYSVDLLAGAALALAAILAAPVAYTRLSRGL
jgi:membrane-associated phospholipid phosphatase